MIHVIATIETEPGKRAEVLQHFNANVPKVLAEEGCLEYGAAIDVKTDIAVQLPLRENVMIVVEKWSSLAHLEAHLTAPHMAAYREKVKGMIKSTSLQVLEPA